MLFLSSLALALEDYQGSLSMTFNPQNILIHSPENTTYSFLLTDPNYTILVNASSNSLLDSWNYELWNILEDSTETGEIPLDSPSSNNITLSLNASQGLNRLTILASDVNNQVREGEVFFTIDVPNTAPIIENISEEMYVCENEALKEYMTSYDFDGDTQNVNINPRSPFYIRPFLYTDIYNLVSEIYSGILGKSRIGVYPATVSVDDGVYSDSRPVSITVIEINNPPVIPLIGVQTVWLTGDNSIFNKTVFVTDTEDGNQDDGNLNFSISFEGENLFGISQTGNMYLVANSSQIGVHNITVCATDNRIDNIHQNISLCDQDGSSIQTCSNFSLTVTNENRAPTITDYYPENLSLTVTRDGSINMNITKYDPDGTIPDTYWFVGGVLNEYDSGSSVDTFTYSFGCGVSTTTTVKAEITDGVLNDSITWTLNVNTNACPVSTGGGGGGGGGGPICYPNLACESWAMCQNAEESLNIGLLSGEDYRMIKQQCDEQGYHGDKCGFQIRTCIDFNDCIKSISPSESMQSCFFTINPNCNDKIKNCHDNSCEILVDCGGPCEPCPTCSDGIQNQGEEGVDCGGPCPKICPKRAPRGIFRFFQTLTFFEKALLWFFIILLIILITIMHKIRKIAGIKKEKKRIIQKYFRRKGGN